MSSMYVKFRKSPMLATLYINPTATRSEQMAHKEKRRNIYSPIGFTNSNPKKEKKYAGFMYSSSIQPLSQKRTILIKSNRPIAILKTASGAADVDFCK